MQTQTPKIPLRITYRCCLCGERFQGTTVHVEIAADGIPDTLEGEQSASGHEMHICRNGDYGLGEFIGLMRVTPRFTMNLPIARQTSPD